MKLGFKMTNETFEIKLKEVGLTKKKFSKIVDMSYGGVVNWGRESQTLPNWLDSWLELYAKNVRFEQLKQSIKESGACDHGE